jgi:hypothetical protein
MRLFFILTLLKHCSISMEDIVYVSFIFNFTLKNKYLHQDCFSSICIGLINELEINFNLCDHEFLYIIQSTAMIFEILPTCAFKNSEIG